MSDTPMLADLIRNHLAATGSSARSLAEKLDASYPSVLAWMSKGGVPRKPEHREGLRRELAMAPDAFARVLAASAKDPTDIPDSGPLDLRQLVLRHLGERNFTERTFADLAGIPYATLMGVTRRGAVPRGATIEQLARAMNIDFDVVREAAARTRGEAEAAGHPVEITNEPEAHATVGVDPPRDSVEAAPTAAPAGELARLATERVAGSGLSVAAYARTHGLPYLALSRLLATGIEPEDQALRAQLSAAFPAPHASATGRIAPPSPRRGPAESETQALHRSDDASPASGHPLHAAILRLLRERGWSQMRFAQESGLAVPTAAKLLKGELPGRGPTHQKLREILGLTPAEYAALLPPTPAAAEPPPYRPAPRVEAGGDEDARRLVEAIQALDENQRMAVWKLVKTFRSG